jgi:hypothetical protein
MLASNTLLIRCFFLSHLLGMIQVLTLLILLLVFLYMCLARVCSNRLKRQALVQHHGDPRAPVKVA